MLHALAFSRLTLPQRPLLQTVPSPDAETPASTWALSKKKEVMPCWSAWSTNRKKIVRVSLSVRKDIADTARNVADETLRKISWRTAPIENRDVRIASVLRHSHQLAIHVVQQQ